MSKNALQAQLLKAGLVDSKKAKKINKQAKHAKRTGDTTAADAAKEAVAQAQAEKAVRDQKLNQQKQQALEQKTLAANIVQMINQHQLKNTQGEVEYQFVDDSKIKKIYITQKLYDQIVAGHVVIARLNNGGAGGSEGAGGRGGEGYALLPHPLAERINEKMDGFIIATSTNADESPDEDDPYAEYVIPDDLMW